MFISHNEQQMKEHDFKEKKRLKNNCSTMKSMKQTSKFCSVFFYYIIVLSEISKTQKFRFFCATFLSVLLTAMQLKTNTYSRSPAKYLRLFYSGLRSDVLSEYRLNPLLWLSCPWFCCEDAAVIDALLAPHSLSSILKRAEKKLGRWEEQERGKGDTQMEKNVQSVSLLLREINKKDHLIHELVNDWANTHFNSFLITFLLYKNPYSLCLFIYFGRAAWDQRAGVMNGMESRIGQKQHLDSVWMSLRAKLPSCENHFLAFQLTASLQSDVALVHPYFNLSCL